LPTGYNAVAGFSALGFGGGDSSSDEEDGGTAGLSREQRLQRKLGLAGSKGAKAKQSDTLSDEEEDEQSLGGDSASSKADSSGESSSSSDESDSAPGAAGGSSDEEDGGQQQKQQQHNPLAGIAAAAAAAAATSSSTTNHHHGRKQERKEQKKAAKAARKMLEARAEALALMVGAPATASGIWGYPFSGPRSQTLFISKRSRRHRLFKWQLALALANVAEDNSSSGWAGVGSSSSSAAGSSTAALGGMAAGPFGAAGARSGTGGNSSSDITMAAAGLTDVTGPVFSAESGFRLDQQGFWGSLPGGSSGWQELTGANDPLVLTGRYSASEGAGSAAGEITVILRAFNR
jgi:hypothetical protein